MIRLQNIFQSTHEFSIHRNRKIFLINSITRYRINMGVKFNVFRGKSISKKRFEKFARLEIYRNSSFDFTKEGNEKLN